MQDSMETAQKTSKKRKQSSASANSPFSGVLTRQKSQKFFVSHNRSGKSRVCRSSLKQQLPTKNHPQFDADCAANNGDGDDQQHVSIKDLRARRVFSKPPKNEILGKAENLSSDSDSELIDCKVKFIRKFGDNPSSSIKEIDGFKINLKGEGVDNENPNLCVPEILDDYASGFHLTVEDLTAVNCDSSELPDDCGVDPMIVSLAIENPNLPVNLEKCDIVTDSGNPNSTVAKKGDDNIVNSAAMDVDVENPSVNSLVLKKCGSGGNGDGSMVNLSAEGSKDGDCNQLTESGKCEPVIHSGFLNSLDDFDSMICCGEKTLDDMSPAPDLSIPFGKSGVENNSESVNEEALQSTPPDSVFIIRRSPTKQASPTKDGSSEGKNVPNSINGMTLTKHSKRKVFKVPNSFTYKRLLPYLMDMAKDEPCAMKAIPSVKIENNVEETPFVSLSQENTCDAIKLPENLPATVTTCVPEDICVDRNDEFSSEVNASEPVNCCADDSQTELVSSEIEVPDSLEKGVLSQDEHDLPDTNHSATFLSSEAIVEVSKKDTSSADLPCHLSVSSQEEMEKEESLVSKCKSLEKRATLEHVGGFARGILKRNPRGCRGICSCLECCSFRLNANKAFEFSRNQLAEAEEVAHDLMKELSGLKFMLKTSITGVTEVNQVEEACRRASDVEDMAKSRLSQMREDLYVHSRAKVLLRPRVNFAINARENEHLV